MKIIITGSSGFIGTNFIKHTQDINIVEVDLLTQKILDIDFTNIDSALHLAALVHQMKGAPEQEYFKINRDLAYDVAKKAKSQGVKHFVFMSTAKVFGESTTGKIAWDENSDCNPLDAYGRSKYEAEKLLMGLQDEFFKVAVVRSPLVYGVGVKGNMYKLINLVKTLPILPLGGINNRRSMVYVGNLVALLEHIIKAQASGVFIAGDQFSLSTTELIKLIAKSNNKKLYLLTMPHFLIFLASKIKPEIIDRLFGSLELDTKSTNRRLGFAPPYSSDHGICEMLKWFEK
jgi:nucleoside-diphosphate-sugar epimerase